MTEQIPKSQKHATEILSDDFETHPRAFRLETIPLNDRNLTLLSLEADYITDGRITPPDWQERVSQAIQDADLTFVEYFVPELEDKIPYIHKLGSFSRNITETYGAIADIAHAQGKDVAVADIANKPLYEAYHLGIFPVIGAAAVASARQGGVLGWTGFATGEAYVAHLIYQAAYRKGTYAVEPSRIERYMVNANDARRVITAENIARVAQEYPPGSSLLYIAAPAHTARVKAMLEESPTTIYSVKSALYNHLPGLDRGTRLYRPYDDGWELQSAA